MKKFILNNLFIILLIIVIIPFRIKNINQSLSSITQFRQAQTATFTLNFYKTGINLMQTELDVFGMGRQRYLTLEFPFYEAVVAGIYKIFYVHDMWGRVVSVLFGLIGAFYLYKLVELFTKDKSIALLTAFFFLFAPLNMYYQQDFLIESTVIGCLLIGLYYSCRWVCHSSWIDYIMGLLFLSLGFIQKGMYGPFWLLPLVYFYISYKNIKALINPKILIILLIPLFSLIVWQMHVDDINKLNGNEFFTTSSGSHILWNIGTFEERLFPLAWQTRFNQFLNGIFLKPGLIFFLLGLITAKKHKGAMFFYVWLLAEILYFLIFFRIQSHYYYQMIMIPAFSFFMAMGLIYISRFMAGLSVFQHSFLDKRKILIYIFIACIGGFFAYRSWISSQWDFSADQKWINQLQLVGKSVSNHSNGIFVNPQYDWNSIYSYLPQMKLLSISIESLTEENISEWKKGGYSYIILHYYKDYDTFDWSLVKKYKRVLDLDDYRVYLLEENS